MKRDIKLSSMQMPELYQLLFYELGDMIDKNADLSEGFEASFEPNVNQVQLLDILESSPVPQDMFIHVLSYGGVRSGKTYGIIWYSLKQMLKFPGVRVLAVRTHLKEVKNSIFADVIDILDAHNIHYTSNMTDLKIFLDNGSEFWMCSDKALVPHASDKADSLGGTQFSIIILEECIFKENLVHTSTGKKRICDIQPEELVYGWDGFKFGLYPVTVVKCNGTRPTFNVTLSNGKVLRATGNHPILTQQGWKRVAELQPKDKCYSMPGMQSTPEVFKNPYGQVSSEMPRVPQAAHGQSKAMPGVWEKLEGSECKHLSGVLLLEKGSQLESLRGLWRESFQERSSQVPRVLSEEHERGRVPIEAGSGNGEKTEGRSYLSSVGPRGRSGRDTEGSGRGVSAATLEREVHTGLLLAEVPTSYRSDRELLYGAEASRDTNEEGSLSAEAGDTHLAAAHSPAPPEGLERQHIGGYSVVEVVSINPADPGEVWDITVDGCHNFLAEGIVVHNCDSISEELVNTVPGRMSQNVGNFRKAILYACNPPSKNSWVYRMFFEDNDPNDPDSRLRAVFMPMEGNVKHLGAGYIQSVTEDYSRNPQFYKRMRQGLFGANIKGIPYFAKDFQETVHVSDKPLQWNRGCVMTRGWDFGYRGTALTVLQDDLKTRQIKTFRSIVARDCLLESFCDQYLPELDKAFPGAVWEDWVDPAGRQKVTQSSKTCLDILRSKGLHPKYKITSISYGLNIISEQLRLFLNGRPVMLIDPSCEILIEAFMGGYCNQKDVTDDEPRPVKDGWNDHCMDSFRYAVQALRKAGQSRNPDAYGTRQNWEHHTEGGELRPAPVTMKHRTEPYRPGARSGGSAFKSRII